MSPAPLIQLRVPVDPASVAIVRPSVASLAARLDFTLDRLEDLRLATNEACTLLLGLRDVPGPRHLKGGRGERRRGVMHFRAQEPGYYGANERGAESERACGSEEEKMRA